jgi:hypothetical protein
VRPSSSVDRCVDRGVLGTLSEHGQIEPLSLCLDNLPVGKYNLPDIACETLCLGYGDENNLMPSATVKIIGPHDDCCNRKEAGATLRGYATGPSFVARKCHHNFHNALCNRHCKAVKNQCVKSMDRFIADFKQDFHVMQQDYCSSMLGADSAWLDKWPLSKRRLIIKSQAEEIPLPEQVKSFVKREGAHKPPTKARGIQGYANMATQAHIGPRCYTLQKVMTRGFNRCERNGISITFASGFNSSDLGDWMTWALSKYDKPMFYERDGKNWDATMQEMHHELKKQVYDEIAAQEFVEFIDRCAKVEGMSRFKTSLGTVIIKYLVEYTTKSGHNDTTLGNSLINAAISYLSMLECGLKGDVIVAGDDCLIVIDGDFDEKQLAGAEAAFGIEPEYRKFDHVYDVSFISGIWCPSKGGLCFVPKPGRLFKRLFWTTTVVSKRMTRGWQSCVVAGLLPCVKGIPLVTEFLSLFDVKEKVRLSAVQTKELYRPAYNNVVNEFDPETILYWFMHRYKCSEAEMLSARNFLDSLPRGGIGLVNHPLLMKVCDIDLAEIDERSSWTAW